MAAENLIYGKYIDFTKPDTLPVDVTITIKEGRSSVKKMKKTEKV